MTPTPVNEDYRDMLSALKDAGVEYLVVGAYALAAYGNPRATGDIDFWVRPTEENAKRVWEALTNFRAPRNAVSVSDFAVSDTVFQIGLPPRRIDLITSISGVEFDEAWAERVGAELAGYEVFVLSHRHLVHNKLASGRPKDLADVDWLNRRAKPENS
jgi:Nucleotidyl transferase of unknown function (DUF2204)